MDASRVIVCSPDDSMLFEIAPDDIWACVERVELNAQHSLEIVTTRVLSKEQRIVVFDEEEHAHEYVVSTEDREHANGSVPFGTYKCPWSLQHDARLWRVSRILGTSSPDTAAFALEAALSGTNRWKRGTVTLQTYGSASMYQRSGWKALETLIDVWGGEIDAEVTVGPYGVTARRVNLYAQMGEHTAKRRFDYSRDMSSINRHVWQDEVACRIVPRGKGEEVGDGYGRKITIESVNDGLDYLQNDESAAIYRLPDGNGGWEYPIVYVDNGNIETPQKLKEWGLSVLNQYTVPKVSYTMEVTYLYKEGPNPYGVGLGDIVQAVDLAFGDTPLRIEARVTSMTIDRLDRSKTTIVVSNVGNERSLASSLVSIGSKIQELSAVSAGTTEYLNSLLENINAQINATGGWTYLTRGNGTITYDRAVSDPLVGSEANQVTEMKGGTLRFANTKTAQGEWNWTNVITADGYLGLAATIGRITTGFIGSPDSGVYIDLDSHEIYVGGRSGAQINDGIDATITGKYTEYVKTTSNTTAPAQDAEGWSTTPPMRESGKYIWQREVTTYGDGTTQRSNPVCISGADGADGSSVTVTKTEYGTSASAATQPSGWSETVPTSITKGSWLWIRTTYSDSSVTYSKAYAGTDGQNGTNGTDGTSVTVSKVEYGTSSSASTAPASWSQAVPTSIAKGTWLWVRTTYSDSTTATTKSYVGTDGEDGKSVTVLSVQKVGKVTTVTLTDGTTTSTMQISDGSDGTNGTNGVNGLNGYVHVAWANSDDGSSGFSTSDSTDKRYIGVYADNTASDSSNPSAYSWSLIKGADGTSVTVSEVEYGTSASESTPPSTWSTTAPSSVTKGNWLWCRTTYSDSTTATTKSYVGTDGQDGTSVYVTSSSKSGKTTTVTLSDGTALTIVDGQDGANGTNGLNGYVHTAWANSADGTTDFSTTASSGKQYLGVYTDNTAADSTSPSAYSWSLIKGAKGDTGAAGTNGTNGTNGYNTATIMLYQRAVSQPSKPSSDMTYTFSNHSLSGTLGGWSTSVPSGTDPCWVTAATATSNTATDAIAASEWTTPTKFVQNGADGTDGTDGVDGANGLNQATVFLYQRAASQPSVPSAALTYTFSSGGLSGTLGSWTREIPATDGNPCWVTSAVAIANTATDSIATGEWASPTKLVEDGDDGVGIESIAQQYYLSTSDQSATGGNWFDFEPTWSSGHYMWTRYHIVWDDNTDSYTDAVYAEALTDSLATAHHADEGAWSQVTDVAVQIQYAMSDSSSNPPDALSAGWSATATLPTSGRYLWKRDMVTVYHGARETYEVKNVQYVTGYNASLTAVTGQYYLSTSSSSATGGSWSTSCPTWASGKTIWTRVRTTIGGSYSYTTSLGCVVAGETSATEMSHDAHDLWQEFETGFHVYDNKIQYAIADAARQATDYITYENGELVLGATDSAVRNVMTNTRNAYRTAAGDIAYFGLDSDGLWRLFIENASIMDMLRFGNFAWIARQNGNMTIKWIGA